MLPTPRKKTLNGNVTTNVLHTTYTENTVVHIYIKALGLAYHVPEPVSGGGFLLISSLHFPVSYFGRVIGEAGRGFLQGRGHAHGRVACSTARLGLGPGRRRHGGVVFFLFARRFFRFLCFLVL